jgi:hypothetical protein
MTMNANLTFRSFTLAALGLCVAMLFASEAPRLTIAVPVPIPSVVTDHPAYQALLRAIPW